MSRSITPKTIGILTQVFYTYGPNSVVLAWTGDELWRGKASDYRTHGRTDGHTDTGNENARGQNWPRVKNNINGSICRKVYTGYRVSYDNTFIDDEINIYGHWH